MVLREDNLIEKVTANKLPHYEPYGWHHWPEHPWLAYQFRRGLGEPDHAAATGSPPARGPGGPLTVRSGFSSIDGDCRQGSRLRRSRGRSRGP